MAPPEEYDCTIRARWRYGLTSNYFDHFNISLIQLLNVNKMEDRTFLD